MTKTRISFLALAAALAFAGCAPTPGSQTSSPDPMFVGGGDDSFRDDRDYPDPEGDPIIEDNEVIVDEGGETHSGNPRPPVIYGNDDEEESSPPPVRNDDPAPRPRNPRPRDGGGNNNPPPPVNNGGGDETNEGAPPPVRS